MQVSKLIEAAFLDGYRKGLEAFSYWEKGQQVLGPNKIPLADILKSLWDDALPAYHSFLDKQRASYESKPEQ